MRRLALVPILAAVLLFPPVATALGLGEIEVHSALNQRLDARIPLRGVPEGRADDVIVALASEKAFRDVGLRRAHALTSLEFAVRQGDDGRHYVHATSSEPIAEPFLSFLLEVDGPGGNLLREYTVLLDPPVFATERSEEAQETEEVAPETRDADDTETTAAGTGSASERGDAAAAAQAETGAAERPQSEPAEEPAAEAGEEPEAMAAAPEEEEERGRSDFGDTPVFLEVERERERAERDAPARAAEDERRAQEEALAEAYRPGTGGPDEQASAGAGDTDTGDTGGAPAEYGPVERGDTLWSIASRLRRGDMTVQQLMLALLRYNPEAFVDDNINRLKHGYVLRVPEGAEVRAVPAQQAIARVEEQDTLWREWRAAARGEGEDTTAAERRAAAADTEDTETAEPDTTAAATEDDESRLSIVGSRDGGASSDESASATRDGQAATEELELAREQLESARMEKAELESRVEDLEETVDKMERLITLRENQLAQLQDQLQQLQQDEAERAAAADDAAGEGPEQPEVAAGDSADDAGAATSGGSGGDGGGSEEPAETAPAEPDEEAVASRTEASPDGWLDRITGIAGGVTAAVAGTLAGLAGGAGATPFAGAASPGTLGAVALLLVALAGLLVVRRRRAAAELDAEVEAMDAAALADADEVEEADLSRVDAGSDLVAEELDSGEFARSGDARRATSGPLEEAFDLGDLEADTGAEAASTPAPEEDEAPKDDTVAEAEVYLAYGLHQQAEDLLRLALRESPERADYHEKLLETLYAAGKEGEFVTEAGTFHGMVESTGSRMWQRVVAMGREIAPEHELFRASAAPDVRPEELQKPRPATADIELDAGEGGAGDEGDDFARSLMLDEADLGGDAGPADAYGGAAGTPGEDEEDLEFDLGDFEQLAAGGEDAGDEDTATAAAGHGAEAGGGADEGLDFDLGDLGGATGDSGPARGGAATADEEGGLDFDIDLDDATGAGATAADAGTGDAAAGAADVPDLDLGDLEPESGPGTAGGDAGEYELDVGDLAAAPGSGSGPGAAAGEGDGADDDEFDTMLDLARAYIDMGDPESASNALEEVIEAGSEKQRNEARSLLEAVQ